MKYFLQSIKVFRMNGVFVKIFLYIILLTLGSLGLVSFFSYQKSSRMMIKEVEVNNMLILEQAQKSIDAEIAFMQSDMMQMALSRNLNKVLYMTLQQSHWETELIKDSISYLSSVKSNNDYISDIWFYQKKANFVLGTGGKYQRSLFLSEVCKYVEDLNWDEIFGHGGFRILGKYNIHQGSYDTPVLVLTESLPFINKEPKGMLVVSLNETLFKKEMANSNKEKIIFNYIIDGNCNVIYTNEKSFADFEDMELIFPAVKSRAENMDKAKETIELSIKGKPYTIQYVKSTELDWKYISVIPTEYITKSVNQIRDVTLLISVISFIISVVLTYYIIAKLYQPMNKIMNYINIIGGGKSVQLGQKKNEFTLINGIIDYIYNENRSLQDNFEKNKPMLQDKYLDDIINGQTNRDNFLASGAEIGIEFPFPYYQVIVYEIGEEKASKFKIYKKSCKEHVDEMRKIANHSLGERCRCYFIEKNDHTVVSVLNAEKSFYELSGINDYLTNIQTYLEENLDEPYTIGVGQSYEDIYNCYLSFIDALEALKYKTVKGENTVIYIDEVSNISDALLHYPLEKETQLITVVKSGKWDAVLTILKSIFRDNLEENKISPEHVEHLFNALAGTAVRAIFEMRLTTEMIFGKNEDIYSKIESKNGLEEKVKYISYVFEMITKYVTENKLSQQSHILDKIRHYLDENYSKDISLDTVAEVVNLSTSYLSFIFKEISGKNFVDYVNEFRIEKAKKLLDETSLNIAQIAEKVGYNSANNFSKVFKKYVGISPGQYRKIK